MQNHLERKCPHCGIFLVKSHRNATVQHKEKPGDISVCFHCGGINVIMGNGELEKLSRQTWDSLSFPEQLDIIDARAHLGKGIPFYN